MNRFEELPVRQIEVYHSKKYHKIREYFCPWHVSMFVCQSSCISVVIKFPYHFMLAMKITLLPGFSISIKYRDVSLFSVCLFESKYFYVFFSSLIKTMSAFSIWYIFLSTLGIKMNSWQHEANKFVALK